MAPGSQRDRACKRTTPRRWCRSVQGRKGLELVNNPGWRPSLDHGLADGPAQRDRGPSDGRGERSSREGLDRHTALPGRRGAQWWGRATRHVTRRNEGALRSRKRLLSSTGRASGHAVSAGRAPIGVAPP